MKASKPLFSVIIPAHGRPQYLEDAVESVLRQSISDLEVIVVDDASPVPLQLDLSDSRLKLMRLKRNGGPSAARNAGLEEAAGRYITFLDDDDVYTERRLDYALESLEVSPIGLCWFTYFGEAPKGRIINGNTGGQVLASTTPHLGSVSVRADILQPFDPRYRASQDIEWWIRMCGHAISTVPKVGYLVRQHDGERHGNARPARIAASLRLLDEHASFFATYPQAAAFRWRRISAMASREGDHRLARSSAWKSIKLSPTPGSMRQLARAMRF